MKKYLLTILCLCTVLTALAAFDRIPLGNQSTSQLTAGTKIAVADAYYVSCDDSYRLSSNNRGYYVIDSVFYSVGWKSTLSYQVSPPFDPTITPNFPFFNSSIGLYGFDVPVHFDEFQNRLWFKAGMLLTTKTNNNVTVPDISPGSNCYLKEVKHIYAIPEQWLLNLTDTATYVINGFCDEEGILTFEGGIAFLIEEEIFSVNQQTGEEIKKSSSSTLSPVYRNIRFYNPNGIHEYLQISDRYPLSDFVIEAKMKDYVRTMEGELQDQGSGNGGRVIRPIDPRPIKSRLQGVPQNITLSLGGFMTQDEVVLREQENRDVFAVCDTVYMTQVNDSTLHVYNLYGVISHVNVFYLYKNRQMILPVQPFDQSTEHSIYNFSTFYSYDDHALMPSGNEGIVNTAKISWGTTIPVNYNGLLDYYFENNKLSFTDGSQFYIPGSGVRGDVNNDGKVTIGDVTGLINSLLSDNFDDSATFNFDNADCNLDGFLKIGDVTALINYLLSGSWPQ